MHVPMLCAHAYVAKDAYIISCLHLRNDPNRTTSISNTRSDKLISVSVREDRSPRHCYMNQLGEWQLSTIDVNQWSRLYNKSAYVIL